MKIKNIILFLFFVMLGQFCFAQACFDNKNIVTKKDSLLPDLEFDVTSLKNKGKVTFNLYGVKYSANKFIVKDTIRRLCRHYSFGSRPDEYKTFKEKYAIYSIKDTNGLIKDTMTALIKSQITKCHGSIGYKNKSDISVGGSAVITENGRYLVYNYRPLYDEEHKHDPELVIWLDGKVYVFEVFSSGDCGGGITANLNQGISIKINDNCILFYRDKLTVYRFEELYEAGFFK
jgi:hypothetical protein